MRPWIVNSHHVYTWSDNKVRELIAVKVLHNSFLNTTVVAFKVLPLGSYAPMPAPSPPFKTILELVLWNDLQSGHCTTPDVINVIKMPSFQYFLQFLEQKKFIGGYFRWIVTVLQHSYLVSSYKNSLTDSTVWAGALLWCKIHELLAKSSGRFRLTFFTQHSQYFQIVNLVDCLSSWYKFIKNNPSNIKKSQQHCFDSWFGLMKFFWSWGIGSLPLGILPLRFRVQLVDPCFITCDDMAQNVILPLQKVLANCDSSLLFFFGELLWDHFCTHLLHVKIFS